MARKTGAEAVLRRPSGRPTGLAARLENVAKSGKLNEFPTGKVEMAGRPFAFPVAFVEDEDESWEAEAPPPSAEDLAAITETLSGRDVEEADYDVLWDAIRADEDKGARFLGRIPQTYNEMRQALTQMGDELFALEDESLEGKALVGFAAFQDMPANHMLTHLYLMAAFRGQAPRLIPQLMALGEGRFPGLIFTVHTKDAAMARMLRGCGFEAQFLLEWKPRVTVTAEIQQIPAVDEDKLVDIELVEE